MEQLIALDENGLHVVIEITADGDVRLLHLSALQFDPDTIAADARRYFRLVELQATGENYADHRGSKHTGSLPGHRLRYIDHADYHTSEGRKWEIHMRDAKTDLEVTSHLQFYDEVPVVRAWTFVTNNGTADVGLEYVSSFALTGLAKEGRQPWDDQMTLWVPHNAWYGESQWRHYRLTDLGLSRVNISSMKRIAYTSTGTWSTSDFLPMGCLSHTEHDAHLFWQIEHNGSWHWELSDVAGHLYLQLSGPTEQEHQWWKSLKPGETFCSVPVAFGAVSGNFDRAMGALTTYRRRIRRPSVDNVQLPVIFNDYMNCLWGDPTPEKLVPLIDAAAEVGCEYFCIDCGWYADGHWWDSVGGWLPSAQRFPEGLPKLLNYIRSKGMVPGLWLELEVIGVAFPRAAEVPDAWFFCRHGKRVIANGRYQLDFRHPEVIAHADEVLDRLVNSYGVGYIKMDYNINAGVGTEIDADSFGDGLLQHNRAYLAWLDRVFDRYPTLVIENCGSGGMRLDYALLSRHSIQSSSDQTDYRKNAVIAAASPAAVTPEQCAVWSYPLADADEEAVSFNMVNALLMRVHQSGQLTALGDEQRSLIREALHFYKQMRSDIPHSVPIWPLGLPTFADHWISLGLVDTTTTYLAIWRLAGTHETCLLTLPHLQGKTVRVACGYPAGAKGNWNWQESTAALSVLLPNVYSARIFKIDVQA